MRRLLILTLCSCLPEFTGAQPKARIQVVPHEVAPRVDVLVDGRAFTSYVYLRSLPRPSLDPIRAATGAVVTRDGFWFGHGDVNGIDFSGGGAPQGDSGAGRIVHRRVIEATSSDHEGQLGVEMTWLGPNEALTMVEDARFAFRGDERVRSIDRLTRLSAVRGPVRLGRNARGLAGIRLAEGFLTRRSVILGPEGHVDRDDASGARRPWLAVSGFVGSHQITVALLDHPQNPGFPNAWRLDESGALEITPTADVNIDAGRSVTFRHRLVVSSGQVNAAAIAGEFQRFSAPSGRPQ